MDKILFLDFDGVLFDTVDEAYQVCINTKLFRGKILPLNSLFLFRKYRPFVGPAWNYYYIIYSIINNTPLRNIDDFYLTDEVRKFEDDFFATRARIQKNYSNWLKYNKKYPFLDELKQIIDKNIQVYIITTKDKKTVKDLLNNYKIDFIDNEFILDKNSFYKFGSKKEIILNVLKNKNYKALFIDDLYSHLKLCENIKNLKLIQADWGYIDEYNTSQYLFNEDESLEAIKDLRS